MPADPGGARQVVSSGLLTSGGGIARLEVDRAAHLFLTCDGCGANDTQADTEHADINLATHAALCITHPKG
jgi:hypothetical protein